MKRFAPALLFLAMFAPMGVLSLLRAAPTNEMYPEGPKLENQIRVVGETPCSDVISTASLALETADALTTATFLVTSPSAVLTNETVILGGSAILDFSNAMAGTSEDKTITVTGAQEGQVVALGIEPGVFTGGSNMSHAVFCARVSAEDTVTVTFYNNALALMRDPHEGEFTVKVFPW